jgi:hypothetical protein
VEVAAQASILKMPVAVAPVVVLLLYFHLHTWEALGLRDRVMTVEMMTELQACLTVPLAEVELAKLEAMQLEAWLAMAEMVLPHL